ncbi:MAG: hypothetical protein Q4C70_06090, partial [Planctomycetia bacterium]|nr:hypothetical protein [Planctomycetia bacterium]
MKKVNQKFTVLGMSGLLSAGVLTFGISGITGWLGSPVSAEVVMVEEKIEEGEETLELAVFLPIPRELRRAMEDAEKLMEMERYAEAVRQLDAILGAEEDYFFRKTVDGKNLEEQEYWEVQENAENDGKENGENMNGAEKTEPYRNMKLAAEELLENMPTRGKEMYEIEFGTSAKVMLEEALKNGKMEQLARVAQRYFFTQAGSEAAFLQGIYLLDCQKPAAAREIFGKLQRFPRVGERFEPILTLYYAASCLASGKIKEGERVLIDAEKKGGAEWNALEIGGVSIQEVLKEARAESVGKIENTPSTESKESTENSKNSVKPGTLATWLQKKMPSWGESWSANLSDGWQLVLHNQARSSDNGEVSMPILTPCWRVSMLDDPEGVVLAELLRTKSDLFPSHSPLVVGETVLMRTAW